MYLVATCLVFLLLSPPPPAAEAERTYCDDPAVWADWQEKATQQTGNLDFQTLHALWIGLCTKIGNGTITEEEADMLFERARTTLRQQRRKERQPKTVPRRCSYPACGCQREKTTTSETAPSGASIPTAPATCSHAP